MSIFFEKFSLDSSEAANYISEEERIVNEKISREMELFWTDLFAIIRNIISTKINDKNKKIVMYFLSNLTTEETANIISTSYRNVNQKYWYIIANIRAELCWDQDFLDLLEYNCPSILRGRMKDWLSAEQRKNPKVKCPVCKEIFSDNILFKNHLLSSRYHVRNKSELDIKHIEFIESQERMIDKRLEKYGKHHNSWSSDLVAQKNFYLGYWWVYNYCKKKLK